MSAKTEVARSFQDLYEVNEAFASGTALALDRRKREKEKKGDESHTSILVPLTWMKELNARLDRLNVNGG